MVSIGDHVPDIQVMIMTGDGPQRVQTGALLGQGKAVLFAVPGAFTPVCSDFHLPGFVLRADDLKAKGIDTIACVAVNDPFVMSAWGKAEGANGDIIMLADPDAAFTSAMGMDTDASEFGLVPARSATPPSSRTVGSTSSSSRSATSTIRSARQTRCSPNSEHSAA
jgi:peroxiredoxin